MLVPTSQAASVHTFILIISSLSPSGGLRQIRDTSLKPFQGYHIYKDGQMNRQPRKQTATPPGTVFCAEEE